MSGKDSKNKVSKFIAVAVAIALTGASAHAEVTSTKQGASKEQKIGMASGTVAGALIGGPFGAAVGFIVGSVAGTHAQQVRATEKKATILESQLAATQQELTSAQVALAKAAEKSNQDPMLTELAQRLRADVLFRTASAELDATAASKLADLAAVLTNYPGLVIEIDGYADPRGKAGENFELSQQRASAVRAALIVGGANPDSIRVAAHGEQLSTAAKGDMEAYAWERRVSLSVNSASKGLIDKGLANKGQPQTNDQSEHVAQAN
jgi:outer membrane protein OmpA-like peptidoglycan-associated protein